ncbi:hypothetical protein Cgig2_023523 [Carnegiea gigantea]|uniref:Auxin response factor n=1 Tax=Carnegiea gigantea TaxID=171969 RepID=A0A9Q1JLJ4_9CARY|nr:hypothetical protein Cgig2_023523 [Carnegiea gigantea]
MATDHHHRQFFYQHQQQQQQQQRQQKQQRLVDPAIWRACAGTSVQIPAVQSRVYYFPQGHMEQASATVTLSPLVASKPLIPCRVLQVLFLADRDTDEVFAKIRLEPIRTGFVPEPSGSSAGGGGGSPIVSFAKVLTPSDANNGGGFSVPRFCADSIFPPLDYDDDPPVQNIRISDVHGECWDFRHIYRGTPRRHLLTTGWSKFVNSKKLIAGDSVVFMRNKVTDELFVGVRRAVKSNEGPTSWATQYGGGGGTIPSVGSTGGGGFSRNGKGRVPPEALVEAAERAANNLPFEVVYYPRAGLPDFVVAAEKVEEAMSAYWSAGMRVKMAMETEDSSRMTWFQGTVASVVVTDNGLWRGTIWRMLQVAWDEPEILQNMKRVSPWQVEVVASTPPIHTVFPPAKRFRVPHTPGLLADGEGNIPLPTVGFNSMMGQLSPSYLNYNTSPAGMQGARQNPFFGSSLPSIMNDGARQTCPDNHVKNMSQKVEAVSTDLNIGSSSSDTPSPDSQNSVQFLGMDTAGQQSCNSSKKAGITSFQLFGKIIHMEQPTDGIGCTDYDDCGTEGARSTLKLALSDPCTTLPDRLGAQCQRSSVVEAFVNG